MITSKEQDKRKIIRAYHNVLAYGHPGINRTKDLVAKYYWWPQLAKDVQEYVKGCAQCQQNKVNMPSESPTKSYHASNRSTTIPDHINGLYCEIARVGGKRLYSDYHGP